MRTSSERILTTHTGSLPRADGLVAPMLAHARGETIDAAAYDGAMRDAVHAIVRRQVDLGIDVIDDGEQSKPGFVAYVNERLAGYERDTRPKGSAFAGSRELLDFPEYYAEHRVPGGSVQTMVCTGPIAYQGEAQLRRDLANLQAAIASCDVTEVFVPAASPASIEGWQKNTYYDSDEAYLFAIGEAMRTEYEAIVGAGFLVQLDDPWLAMHYMLDPDASVDEVLRWGKVRVEALNYALRNIPPDRIRYHTCYGINMGPRTSDLELRHFVRLLFEIRAGALSFEAANPRHEHEFELFEHVRLPEDKVIIPGVITHTSVLVEHPELVAQRIVRFAKAVGRERVLAGSDCGFATNPGRAAEVHEKIVWAKLAALVAGARLASAALW